VLANGTSGSAQTGAVTLTTPQNIGTGSSPTFLQLTITQNISADSFLVSTDAGARRYISYRTTDGNYFLGEYSGSTRATIGTSSGNANLGLYDSSDVQTVTLNSAGVSEFEEGLTVGTIMTLPTSAVGSLPSAAASEGAIAYVNDATSTTRLSTAAGGGSNKVIVFSDGANWLIL
jgi:hypothetical protein